ncbi:MAG TPA: ATP-binding protein [Fibrobacteria bacterium]|nr:ATP-binding protein [Fibrobacteria bacterium]
MPIRILPLPLEGWLSRTAALPAMILGGGAFSAWILIRVFRFPINPDFAALGSGTALALFLSGANCCLADWRVKIRGDAATALLGAICLICAGTLAVSPPGARACAALLLVLGLYGLSIRARTLKSIRAFSWTLPPLVFGAAFSRMLGSIFPDRLGLSAQEVPAMMPYACLAVLLLSLKHWVSAEMERPAKDTSTAGLLFQFLIAGWTLFLLMIAGPLLDGADARDLAARFELPAFAAVAIFVSLLFSALAVRFARISDGRSRLLREQQALVSLLRRKAAEAESDAEQFLQKAAHDMQAPVRHVSGFVRLLLQDERFKTDPDKFKFAGYVQDGCQRMVDMISSLVDWGRTGKAEVGDSQVDLGEVFRAALSVHAEDLSMAGGTAGISGALPRIGGSRPLLEKMASALVLNCIKYRSAERSLRIHIEAVSLLREIGFRIEDNGMGIKPEFREKVFAPFQRLHAYDKIKGLGIGLAMARKIIQKHNGRIYLEDGTSGGIAVVAVFPRSA